MTLKLYKQKLARLLKLSREVEAARKELAKNCTHPEIEPYEYEHDNGYGRQTRHEAEYCKICYGINAWPTLNGSWRKHD